MFFPEPSWITVFGQFLSILCQNLTFGGISDTSQDLLAVGGWLSCDASFCVVSRRFAMRYSLVFAVGTMLAHRCAFHRRATLSIRCVSRSGQIVPFCFAPCRVVILIHIVLLRGCKVLGCVESRCFVSCSVHIALIVFARFRSASRRVAFSCKASCTFSLFSFYFYYLININIKCSKHNIKLIIQYIILKFNV